VTRKLLLLASALSLFAVTPVWAGMITFNFADCGSIVSTLGTGGTCPGDLKTPTATFDQTPGTANPLYVTATGFSSSTYLATDLYVKHGGTSETGLGLAGGADDEINAGQLILLNMSDLISHGIFSGTVWLGSLQSGEYGRVCDATLSENPFSNCQTVSESGSTQIGSAAVSWSSSNPWLAFRGPKSSWQWCDSSGGNFLIDSLTVQNSVPEPGSLALFGLGLAALGLAVASRKRAPGR
jgi:hypothetical protein